MKIVNILGGLGNQMFQYALYLALREKFKNEVVKVDRSCFKGYPLHNGFELDKIFQVDCEFANWKDLVRVSYPYLNYRCWQIGKCFLLRRKTMCIEPKNMDLKQDIFDIQHDCFYDGYWQHEEYFKDIRSVILKAFTFPILKDKNLEIWKVVQKSNSASIHVRRGDYLNHPYYKDICELDYYHKAIQYLKDVVAPDVFLVFSNDTEWCRNHLQSLLNDVQVIYVDWNTGSNSYIDMQLMSGCKYNIIANSSFSWWGAWLNTNEDKIVIAPKKWMNIDLKVDPICTSWKRI